VLYIALSASQGPVAGRLWLTQPGARPLELLRLGGGNVSSAAFTPEPDRLIVARQPLTGAAAGGIWVISVSNGEAQQLAVDGWLPRWLP
jgi:hypothetical protein